MDLTPAQTLLQYLSYIEARANAATLKAQCNRYVNGECRTLNCLKRGGYNGGPYNPDIATCEPRETVICIESLTAALQVLVEGMCEIRGDKGFPIETPEELSNYSFARALAILKGD